MLCKLGSRKLKLPQNLHNAGNLKRLVATCSGFIGQFSLVAEANIKCVGTVGAWVSPVLSSPGVELRKVSQPQHFLLRARTETSV